MNDWSTDCLRNAEERLVCRSKLRNDLARLGLCAGDMVMLHASVKAIGWIIGGPDVVLQAILDVLTPEGTLMMYVGSEDSLYEFADWPPEKQRLYLEELPPFDPATTRACREWSILTEYLRTWPGACRSGHPDGSFAAVGRLADWMTREHPMQYGYGPGSPLARLVEAGGKVLLLGSPLNCVTLLHHAEHLADVSGKPIVRYPARVVRDGETALMEIEEFDTSRGIPGYQVEDYFHAILTDYIAAGGGASAEVGYATSYLLDAVALCSFAVDWLERSPRGGREGIA